MPIYVMWKQHLFLIVHAKIIFQSPYLQRARCSELRAQPGVLCFVFSTPLHPPAIRFSTLAPYVASVLITQEELAKDTT